VDLEDFMDDEARATVAEQYARRFDDLADEAQHRPGAPDLCDRAGRLVLGAHANGLLDGATEVVESIRWFLGKEAEPLHPEPATPIQQASNAAVDRAVKNPHNLFMLLHFRLKATGGVTLWDAPAVQIADDGAAVVWPTIAAACIAIAQRLRREVPTTPVQPKTAGRPTDPIVAKRRERVSELPDLPQGKVVEALRDEFPGISPQTVKSDRAAIRAAMVKEVEKVSPPRRPAKKNKRR
jgi:hypothetical protein